MRRKRLFSGLMLGAALLLPVASAAPSFARSSATPGRAADPAASLAATSEGEAPAKPAGKAVVKPLERPADLPEHHAQAPEAPQTPTEAPQTPTEAPQTPTEAPQTPTDAPQALTDDEEPDSADMSDTGDYGAYLASRQAAMSSDYAAGVYWFGRALIADPDSRVLLEGSVLSNIGVGDFPRAAEAARRLAEQGGQSQIGSIAITVDQVARGEFVALVEDQKAGRKIGVVLDMLIRSWAELGSGHMAEAIAGFDELAKNRNLQPFALYHKALALATVGDFEGADRIFSGGDSAIPLPVPGRGIMARVEVLSQLERNDEALALIASAFGNNPDPMLDPLRARLEAGETLPFDVVRTPTDGIAEVFFSLAGALNGEANAAYTLIYARAAAFLRPDFTDAVLLAGGLLDEQKQYEQAAALYATVSESAPAHYLAEIGRAEATYAQGSRDASLEILSALARKYPQNISVQVALGDGYKREEKWLEAQRAYDVALALPVADPVRLWPIFFSRGICYEQMGDFPKAEIDMRKALELQPDQAQVLNYLGYSYVDRGMKLDEALSMIQRAVEARPDSGYIIDSLAWALYRLGRYDEAVGDMEKASLLEPVDPVVTDHLGDVYWAVGRRMEARFQWRRALSFSPEDKDATRIRRKLEIGLDAVLAEEGAAPLKTATASTTPVAKSADAK